MVELPRMREGVVTEVPLQSDVDAPGPSSRVPLQSEVR